MRSERLFYDLSPPMELRNPRLSVCDPPYSGNVIKSLIPADNRLSVINCKSGNPIVVFPQSLPMIAQTAVHVCGRIGNPIVEPINRPFAQPTLGRGRGIKQNGELRYRNTGGADYCPAMTVKEIDSRPAQGTVTLIH